MKNLMISLLAGLSLPLFAVEVVVFRERGDALRFSVEGGKWQARGAWINCGENCNRPMSGTVIGNEVFVADCLAEKDIGDANILRFGFDGKFHGVFARNIGFNPSCMATSPDGKFLYVACAFGRKANSLWRFKVGDSASPERVEGAIGFGVVRAMAFGGDGLLYASCRQSSTLRAFDVSGKIAKEVGLLVTQGTSTGGLALDAKHGLLVLPGRKCEVIDLNTGKRTCRKNAGTGNAIGGAVVDDRLYIADRGNATILEVTANGSFSSVATVSDPLGIVALNPVPASTSTSRYAYEKIFMSRDKCDFVPVPYNNPKARPFLHAGLCAAVMAIDLNGDGVLDLVTTSGSATPMGGRFAWLNVGGKGKDALFDHPRKYPFPGPGDSLRAVQVEGKTLVVSASGVYEDFATEGFNRFRPWKDVPWNVHWDKVVYQVRTLADMDGDGRLDLVAGLNDIREYGWDDFYDQRGNWKNARPHGYVWWIRNAGKGAGLPGDGEESWEVPRLLRLENRFPVEAVGRFAPMPYDWDGDGDLDLVCSDASGTMSYFENLGNAHEPVFNGETFLRDVSGGKLDTYLNQTMGMATDFDGDGIMDIVVSEEDGRVSFIQGTGKLDVRHTPLFEKPVVLRVRPQHLAFGSLSTPCAVDWDGDGDLDLIVGEAGGSLAFIENLSGKGVNEPSWAEPRLLSCEPTKENVFAKECATPTTFKVFQHNPIRIQAGTNGSHLGPIEAKYGYTVVSAADWDGDGLVDLMVSSIWGKPLLFRNIGSRTSPRLAAPEGVEVAWNGEQPARKWNWFTPKEQRNPKELISQWRTTPAMVDLNRDGMMDLVMFDSEGYFAFFQRTTSGLQAPARVICYESGAPIKITYGDRHASGRRKFCFTDWDGDGELDMIVNGYNAEFWKGLGRGKDGKWRFRNEGSMAALQLAGHTTCPTAADFDGDGIPDLILGAEDGYIYRLNNPRKE